MTLKFDHEEIVCHAEEVDSKKPSLEARVIVTFEDENGHEWRCNKVIKLRLRKRREGADE
jgi:hypothetical protein